MNGEIYNRVLRQRDSADGAPETVVVTTEANGFCVWTEGEGGTQLVRWFQSSREDAIEFAVAFGGQRRGELEARGVR
jgi:hypothetical protein